ncbi:MAG: hydroxymethylglutaryl-CoA lyase [Pseudomonadota bacterium]
MAAYPPQVRVVEVGPRDGLQSEPLTVDTNSKIELINRLSETGLRVIEATSFVSPQWIPQLADAEAVCSGIQRHDGVDYPVLVPNRKGLERALAVGVKQIALFTAASQTFCWNNIHCSIEQSLERYEPVITCAKAEGIEVRAYLSCVLGCPYEGEVDVGRVAELAQHFVQAGCYEISLGDTIGCGTPLAAQRMVATVAQTVPMHQLAIHFHDTRGQALANIVACLKLGVAVVDAAVAGLGGCPYATGVAGNVATEDLVTMLHGMGIETGIDLEKLIDAGRFISQTLSRENRSRVGRLPS